MDDATKSNTRAENCKIIIKRKKLFTICCNVLGDDIGNRLCLWEQQASQIPNSASNSLCFFESQLKMSSPPRWNFSSKVKFQGPFLLQGEISSIKPLKTQISHDRDCISNKTCQPNFSMCWKACSDRGSCFSNDFYKFLNHLLIHFVSLTLPQLLLF